MSRKKSNIPNAIKRRIWTTFSACIIVYSFLIYRITDIQFIKSDEYTQRLKKQNIQTIDLNSGRGVIYDRNEKALTDTIKENVMIVQKEEFIKNAQVRALVEQYSELELKDIYLVIEKQLNSSVFQIKVKDIDDATKEKLIEKNIIVEERTLRYSEDMLLSHTIGYIKSSDKLGQSGIEKDMNDTLQSSNENYVSVFKPGDLGNVDKIKMLKGGIKTVNKDNDAKHIKLTIDKDIQRQIEKIVDKEENPTAVVVSDINTGEILAMTSRPNFDPNNVAKYNSSEKGELINRSIQGIYPPGSAFKIVVLHSALDNKIIDESYMYNCTGKVEKSKIGEVLNCNNREGHGMQTLEQAFANSCNTAFFDIATKTGKENIIETSTKLHLNEPVDIGLEEEKYRKMPTDIDMGNLSIGQGSVGVTPLQINQMTQIIGNNGTYKPLYIYDSIINSDKKMIKNFKTSKEEEIISPYTTTIVKEMMKEVSKEGTGKNLKDLKGGCGVKTGTAQSTLKGKQIEHGWITGFYPEENSKYVITVLVEGTETSNKSALPIFKEICQKLSK